MRKETLLLRVLVSIAALALPASAMADSFVLTRIGARTDRPKSTIEARGDLQVDDAEGFVASILAGGISGHFEYTDTVTDVGFADGDAIPLTEFRWDPATCAAKGNSVRCNDLVRRSYIQLRANTSGSAAEYSVKAYIRRIEPPLYITPNFGSDLRFVLSWSDLASGPASIEGVADRCDWKRGPLRTSRHVKCPTLCGGSAKAVCGSVYCEGSRKCG